MGTDTVTAMDGIEIGEFLETQQTGVLSLSKDGESYAIPVSYTYDEEPGSVYLRLGYAPGSQKRKYVDATEFASFVVYDRTPDGWKSVVARGRLEELSETSLDSAVVESVRNLDIPFFKVFDRPVSDIEFNVVRLDVSEINGIVSGGG